MGPLLDPALNDPTKILVNDLDLRLISQSGSIYYPWKLNPDIPLSAATTGDNDLDNVEQIYVENLEAGYYTIQISHKGDIGSGQKYSLIVSGMKKAGIWEGDVSQNWNEADNWTCGAVPNGNVDVIIPAGYDNFPNLYSHDSECKSLTIESGATMRIFDEQLTVLNDVNIYGTFELWHPAGVLYVQGDIDWKSGSSANINADNQIKVEGDWYFREGANAQLDNGSVQFLGYSNAHIYSNSANSNFNNLDCYIGNRAYLEIDSTSTETLNINNQLYCHTGATIVSNSDYPTTLSGNMLGDGVILYHKGYMIFNGENQEIYTNIGSYFYNIISSSQSLQLTSRLNINGDFRIDSGTFYANDNLINIGGNWTNLAGDSGFVEGTSTVKFYGIENQICNGETFYHLKLANGAATLIIPSGSTTQCSTYDWISGKLQISGGTFTALDLYDDSIKGDIIVNSGEVNLHQDTGNYIDLNCNLTIIDGYVSIYGGYTNESSYWAYSSDASLSMSGGILDFKDRGITIPDPTTWELTLDITGGSIKTAKDFTCNSPEFNPESGTLIFTSSADASLDVASGSTLPSLIIDKADRQEILAQSVAPHNNQIKHISRDTGIANNEQHPTNRANQLTLESSIYVHGDITIGAGTFSAVNDTIQLHGNWANYVGDAGFDEGEGSVIFSGSNDVSILTDETFYNLECSKSSVTILDLKIPANVTVITLNDLDVLSGTIVPYDNTTLDIRNDLKIYLGAGINATQGNDNDLFIGHDWLNYNDEYNYFKGFYPGNSTVTFMGSGNQIIATNCDYEDFYNLTVNKPSGQLSSYDNINVYGDFNIIEGSLANTSTSLNYIFYGDFDVSNLGSWDDIGNTIIFKGIADQHIYFGDPASVVKSHIIIDQTSSEVANVDDTDLLNSQEFLENVRNRNQHVYLLSGMKQTMDADLTINEGTFSLNGHTYTGSGAIAVNDGGTLLATDGSQLLVGASLTVGNGGLLQCSGTAADGVLVSQNSDYYDLIIESGGTISAVYTIFEYMTSAGVNINNGSIIDPVYPFDHCTFREGTENGTLLTINNGQTITIVDALFPNNSWSGSYNVSKEVNQGSITFEDAIGAFSGSDFENDEFSLIDWTGLAPDLIITDVAWSNQTPTVGEEITVEVVVKNIGNAPIDNPFNVDFYPHRTTAPSPGYFSTFYSEVQELNAGDSVVVVFAEITSEVVANWTSWVQLDCDQFVTESNEDNNVWGPDYVTWQAFPAIDDLDIDVSEDTITLSWSYPYTVDGFNIYRGLTPDFEPDSGNPLSSVDGLTNSWNTNASSTNYFYKVTAVRIVREDDNPTEYNSLIRHQN